MSVKASPGRVDLRMGTRIPDTGKGTCELPEKGGQHVRTGVRRGRVLCLPALEGQHHQVGVTGDTVAQSPGLPELGALGMSPAWGHLSSWLM